MPLIFPIIVLVVAILLVLVPLVSDPKIEYIYALLFMVLVCSLYVPIVVYREATIAKVNKFSGN